MEINYTLDLPRDGLTVPVVRRLVSTAMEELGVVEDHVNDVALAVTEACANVVEHSNAEEDDYGVLITFNEVRCEISIVDSGRGFDAAGLDEGVPEAEQTAERGRGIALMHALVDNATFTSEPSQGTIVRLVKNLDLRQDSVVHKIERRQAGLDRAGS
jgi:serine/threonine-protein kinase RsbW